MYKHLRPLVSQYDPTMSLGFGAMFKNDSQMLYTKLGLTSAPPVGDVLQFYYPNNPDARIIGFTHRNGTRHAVSLIRRDPLQYEFYDSVGDSWERMPQYVKDVLDINPAAVIHSSRIAHQRDRENCIRHAITRISLSHMTDAEYDRAIKKAMVKYETNADGVIEGCTNNTANLGPTEEPGPQQSLKFGGIVYGRKHGR